MVKKCKICRSKYKPYNSLQVVCSPNCALILARQKKEKQAKRLELFKKEEEERKSLNRELTSTKLMVHGYIRLRDKGKPCISCGAKWNDTFQAGHFYKAELYSELRFDFDNINSQCMHCNLRLEGNLNAYALKLPNRIGEVKYQQLNERARKSLKTSFKWDRETLKEIRKQVYKLKKELLTKNKNNGTNRKNQINRTNTND